MAKRDELVEQAEALGIEVPDKATKAEIQELIDSTPTGEGPESTPDPEEESAEEEAVEETVPDPQPTGQPVQDHHAAFMAARRRS